MQNRQHGKDFTLFLEGHKMKEYIVLTGVFTWKRKKKQRKNCTAIPTLGS